MLRLERRLLIDCLGIGIALTLLVIAADGSGLLSPLENFLYDLRVRTCQFFAPTASDKLVHLDIDDRSLETIGGWPWPRNKWARILDEIRLAAPKAVEMDVVFSEPQPVEYRKAEQGKLQEIDHDARLAEAVGRCGNVIVPLSLDPTVKPSAAYRAMVELYRGDPEMSEAELEERLGTRGFHLREAQLAEQIFQARREAIYQRVAEEVRRGDADLDEMRQHILPKTDASLVSPLVRQLREQFDRYLAVTEFSRFSYQVPSGAAGQIAPAQLKLVPLRAFSENASGGAFVDYPAFDGPVVRTVPLFLRAGEQVYAQMGLRLACEMLDADLSRSRVEREQLIVPREHGAPLSIPIAPEKRSTGGERIGTLIDIPWIGARDWQTMYDPAHKRIAKHLPITFVWEACETSDKIRRNCEQIDTALRDVNLIDPGKFEQWSATTRPSLDDYEARLPQIEQALKDARDMVALLADVKPNELDERSSNFLKGVRTLPSLREQTLKHGDDLKNQRAELSAAVKDKAVLVGWIATAAVADFVPTPLHDKCPGVVVHGAIFNGIMTGELWKRLPWSTSAAVALIFGVSIAFATARFPPLPALFVAVALACGFALVNGLVLFDYANRILPAAAPLVTIGVVWAGCTMTRVIVVTSEHNRVKRRFSNYVDPKLVNYVLEHPEVSFDGEKREMTVVFTDLAGFTSLSEKLGERIVPLLNELLGELVPVIRDHHNGLVNKFLGDGIMFFFNAPKQDPKHAVDAVATVLDMHAKIADFNLRLAERDLPPISMRAGICTGEMIVGDAGGAGAADYTVLGDSVNLASRLEAANKYTGTRTMMTRRTVELLGDGQFLVRPVGKIKVVGKDEAVEVFEPLAASKDATELDRAITTLSAEMVEKYARRRFEECAAVAARLEALAGPGKLTAMYQSLCDRHMQAVPAEDFDGRIVLTEK